MSKLLASDIDGTLLLNRKIHHKSIENIDRFKNCEVLSLGRKYDLNEIAKNLFETLRKCDDLGVEYILCQGFEEDGVGLAIMNRLNKAAGYDIIKV